MDKVSVSEKTFTWQDLEVPKIYSVDEVEYIILVDLQAYYRF